MTNSVLYRSPSLSSCSSFSSNEMGETSELHQDQISWEGRSIVALLSLESGIHATLEADPGPRLFSVAALVQQIDQTDFEFPLEQSYHSNPFPLRLLWLRLGLLCCAVGVHALLPNGNLAPRESEANEDQMQNQRRIPLVPVWNNSPISWTSECPKSGASVIPFSQERRVTHARFFLSLRAQVRRIHRDRRRQQSSTSIHDCDDRSSVQQDRA